MKTLKKFENWIDDESADTNRRMAELDDEEKSEIEFDDHMSIEKEIVELIDTMSSEVNIILGRYYAQVTNFDDSFTRNELIECMVNRLKE